MTAWLVIVAALGASSGSQPTPCGVVLEITAWSYWIPAPGGRIPADEFDIHLVNYSDHDVTVVLPGDGSSTGDRTPKVSWLVDGQEQGVDGGWCGNINPLTSRDIVTLEPGESRAVTSWIPAIEVSDPGQYEVVLRYAHDPATKWQGALITPHDAVALQKLRGIEKCWIESAPVEIEVTSVAR